MVVADARRHLRSRPFKTFVQSVRANPDRAVFWFVLLCGVLSAPFIWRW